MLQSAGAGSARAGPERSAAVHGQDRHLDTGNESCTRDRTQISRVLYTVQGDNAAHAVQRGGKLGEGQQGERTDLEQDPLVVGGSPGDALKGLRGEACHGEPPGARRVDDVSKRGSRGRTGFPIEQAS